MARHDVAQHSSRHLAQQSGLHVLVVYASVLSVLYNYMYPFCACSLFVVSPNRGSGVEVAPPHSGWMEPFMLPAMPP